MMTIPRIGIILWICFIIVVRIDAQDTSSLGENPIYISAVAWSPDGNHIAAVGIKPDTNPDGNTDEGAILIFDANTGSVNYQSQTQWGGYQSVAWSPDSRYIAVGGEDQTVKIIDVKLGTIVTTLLGHRGTITSLDWNSTGTQLISASPVDQQVMVWDTKTYKPIHKTETGDPWVISFSPDDNNIAVGSFGLRIYPADLDIYNNHDPDTFQYYLASILGMAWSHNGEEIAIGIQGARDVQSNTTSNASIAVVNLSS